MHEKNLQSKKVDFFSGPKKKFNGIKIVAKNENNLKYEHPL